MVMFLLNGGCHNGLISFGKRPWNTKIFIWRIDSLYEIESVKFNAVLHKTIRMVMNYISLDVRQNIM